MMTTMTDEQTPTPFWERDDSADMAEYAQPPRPRYPDIRVKCLDHQGGATELVDLVLAAMILGGVPAGERDQFKWQATTGPYSNLWEACMEWVTCE